MIRTEDLSAALMPKRGPVTLYLANDLITEAYRREIFSGLGRAGHR